MDLNASDEQLAITVAGIVAIIRVKYNKIDGFYTVIAMAFAISLVICMSITVNTSTVDYVLLIKSALRSVWITILSVAGVNIASYVAKKAGNGGSTNTDALNQSDIKKEPEKDVTNKEDTEK